jgi:hypothetical protein
MKSIQTIKVGKTLNISIDGKLYKKSCASDAEADELFRLVLSAKENPTDEIYEKIRVYINDKARIAMFCGLTADPDTGDVFLGGFHTPVPATLVEVVKEYHDNSYPVDAIINFWTLLMANPDVCVRTSAFDFIKTHDFVLTDKGYMVVYKAVAYKNHADNDLREFVSNQYLHIKKDWGCSPNKYVVLQDVDGQYCISKKVTVESWNLEEKGLRLVGGVSELNAKLDQLESQTSYTDKHTGKMHIELGTPVKMDRKNCNSDPAIDCSYGLHVGATKYVENFADDGDAVLVCLVNPMHIVAVPNYNHSKMRVAEYFPFALANYNDGKIDIVEQSYFENDYVNIEQTELDDLIAKIKANELPVETAINAEPESRPMSELLKMLETRLVDLS